MLQCRVDVVCQVGGARQFLSVPEDGEQAFGNLVASLRIAADQLSGDWECFQLFVEPLRKLGVRVTVTNECPVFWIGRHGERSLLVSRGFANLILPIEFTDVLFSI